ncbi:MAG: PAS domain-containing protein [Proteobacteria bacterium]|nr:PAS domain-containing protein [Pseudomonadota bacterium]
MEPVLIPNSKSGIVSRCSITGLPVYTRPEWMDVKLGSNYYMSVSIIGDSILLGKIIGESDLKSVVSATKFIDRVIHEMFGSDRRFVYVEDFTELKNLTNDCKRYYMRYLESKKQMMALVICTMSPLVMLVVKLSSRLKILKCNALVEKDINSAIYRASLIIQTEKTFLNPHQAIPKLSVEEGRCHVSGLTLTEKDEWTRMDLGGPSVTFKLIGERILHTEFHDWNGIDLEVCKKFLEKRERVITSMFASTDRFVEMRNCRGLRWGCPVLLSDKKMCFSKMENDRVLRFISYDLPWMTKMAFIVRRLVFFSNDLWRICKDYNQALKTAVNTLKSQGFTNEGTWNTVNNESWTRDFGDFYVAFEVIDDNVIHRTSKGILKEEYIDHVFKLQEWVLSETGLDQKIHYVLNGLTELEGANLGFRKKYFKKWAAFLKRYPSCQMNVMYGGNSVTRASLSISAYLRPFKIFLVDTPEEAIQLIAMDKSRYWKRGGSKPDDSPDRKDRIKKYADELIYFLGNINWDEDGFSGTLEQKKTDHPFKVVYDAIALIKMDIDELFREREQTQIALIEGEEVARALLNATSDSSILIKTDGTILSANETFARCLGRTPHSLRNENIKKLVDSKISENRMIQLKKVVATGKPARFEDEDAGLCYDNTIYPVFNADGCVDRIAMYSRDITSLKKAEKHIQALTQEIIKAQENERQRIARDLHDNVAQDLASLIISSDTLFEGFSDIPHVVWKRTMKFTRVLKRAISSIRDLAYDLRPPSLDQLGLIRTLSQYCTDFSETNMLNVDFYSGGLDKLDLDFDTEINLYRLIQEALNNVRKHSGANHVTIRLVASYPEIILRIEDNGRGFDPETRIIEALNEKRMGLKSMEERVKLLKGDFTIRSRPGEGTMILVRLPYRQGNDVWAEDMSDRERVS